MDGHEEDVGGFSGPATTPPDLSGDADTPIIPFSRPCWTLVRLSATLTAKSPPRQGSQREDWHLYDVTFDGEVIVSDSRVPECDAARALLAKGFTGKLTILDRETGRPRTIIDIEKAAKLTVLENRRSALRFVKWSPRPEMDAETLEGSANRSSQLR